MQTMTKERALLLEVTERLYAGTLDDDLETDIATIFDDLFPAMHRSIVEKGVRLIPDITESDILNAAAALEARTKMLAEKNRRVTAETERFRVETQWFQEATRSLDRVKVVVDFPLATTPSRSNEDDWKAEEREYWSGWRRENRRDILSGRSNPGDHLIGRLVDWLFSF